MRLALQGDDCWAGRDKLIKNNRQNPGVKFLDVFNLKNILETS